MRGSLLRCYLGIDVCGDRDSYWLYLISSINRERRGLLEFVVELIQMKFFVMPGMPAAGLPLGRSDSAVAGSDVAELILNSHASLP
jgi:hypothetical protein